MKLTETLQSGRQLYKGTEQIENEPTDPLCTSLPNLDFSLLSEMIRCYRRSRTIASCGIYKTRSNL
jgi:hypothetical protein